MSINIECPVRYAIAYKKIKHNYFIAKQVASPKPTTLPDQTESKNSIFSYQTDMEDRLKGPQYDKEGHIILRTLVGKPELFQTAQRHMTGSSKLNLSQYSKYSQYSQDNNIDPSPKCRRTQSNLRRTPQQSIIRQTYGHKKGQHQDEIKIPKADIYTYMQETQTRIIKLRESQRKVEESLPFFEKHQAVKERKCIENYKEQVDKWNDITQEIGSKLNKDSSDTLLFKSQGYRQKVELMEQLNGINEKRIWYYQLRTNSNWKDQKEDDKFYVSDAQTGVKFYPTKTITKIRSESNPGGIISQKLINQIGEKISRQQADSPYLKIEGENKFQKELHLVADITISQEQLQLNKSISKDPLDIHDWNSKTLSRTGTYRMPMLYNKISQ